MSDNNFIQKEFSYRRPSKVFLSLTQFNTWVATNPYLPDLFIVEIKTGSNSTEYKQYFIDTDNFLPVLGGATASNGTPKPFSNATSGTTDAYSRDDHVHSPGANWSDVNVNGAGGTITSEFNNVYGDLGVIVKLLPWVINGRYTLRNTGTNILQVQVDNTTTESIIISSTNNTDQMGLSPGDTLVYIASNVTGKWNFKNELLFIGEDDSQYSVAAGIHNHNTIYYTENELDAFFGATVGGKKQITWNNITDKPSQFTPTTHNHDDIYYTKLSLDDQFDGVATVLGQQKQQMNWDQINNKPTAFPSVVAWDDVTSKPTTFNPSSHNHDGSYYTKTNINNFFGGESGGKKQIDWSLILNKPSSFPANVSYASVTGKPNLITDVTNTSSTDIATPNLTNKIIQYQKYFKPGSKLIKFTSNVTVPAPTGSNTWYMFRTTGFSQDFPHGSISKTGNSVSEVFDTDDTNIKGGTYGALFDVSYNLNIINDSDNIQTYASISYNSNGAGNINHLESQSLNRLDVGATNTRGDYTLSGRCTIAVPAGSIFTPYVLLTHWSTGGSITVTSVDTSLLLTYLGPLNDL